MTTEKKSPFSAGCIVIGLCIAGFVASGIFLLIIVFYRSEFLRARQGVPTINETPVVGGASRGPTTAAEKPSPTAAQNSALEGGTVVVWNRYGMAWKVPNGWDVVTSDDSSFAAKSSGTSDTAWLNVSVSTLPPSFPYDTSLEAMYQQASGEKTTGTYTEVRMLELDGVRGVEFCEAPPSEPSGTQRIQWQAYRPTPDGVQLLNVMVHTSAKDFPSQLDTLYGVLYSTRLSK